MAHVGQELALGHVGDLGLQGQQVGALDRLLEPPVRLAHFLVGLEQLCLGELPFGDVTSEGAVVLLALELHVIECEFDGKDPSVLCSVTGLDCEGASFPKVSPVCRPDLGGEMRVDVVNGHGDELFSRITQRTASRIVDVGETCVPAHPEDRIGSVIDRELGEPQCLLCPIPFGYVPSIGHHTRYCRVVE